MDVAELIEKLRQYDEILLLELLDISSEDLVDKFYDKIEERENYIRQQIEENL